MYGHSKDGTWSPQIAVGAKSQNPDTQACSDGTFLVASCCNQEGLLVGSRIFPGDTLDVETIKRREPG